MTCDSPWLTSDASIEYLTHGERTEEGRRKYSRRWLHKQVKDGKLRAAKIGGRGELLFRREWLDAFVENQAMPIEASFGRKRA